MSTYCYTSHTLGQFPEIKNHKGKPLDSNHRYLDPDELVYHRCDYCGKIYLDYPSDFDYDDFL